jgi:hypothetical protein
MKYFRRAVPVLALTGIGLLAAPLAAAPRSIADCEKIQSADAYNQCLASFGPVAHLHGAKGAPGGDGDGGEGGEASADAGASRHPYSHHGSYRARHHGRQHMEIDVGSGHPHGHHGHGYTHHRRHHR